MAGPSLEQLSEREKQVLRLLASGHTVKSAARITGDSVHAANELLRSARRKTGVASSREAARLVATEERPSQENRDEKIGIVSRLPGRLKPIHLAIGGSMFAILTAIPAALLLGALDVPAQAPHAATDRPHVVSTIPAHGTTIAPGPFELVVTFDRPMLAQWSFWSPDVVNNEHISCVGSGPPRQSEDRKSFTMNCNAKPGAQHTIAFGHEDKGFFKDEDWTDALPFVLSFTVSGERSELALSSSGQS